MFEEELEKRQEEQKQREEELKRQMEDSRNEMLERAYAFEEVQRFDGWKFIKAYIENRIRDFANKCILSGFESMEEFNLERGKVLSLQQLLSEMEASIKTLEDERKRVTTNN